MSSPQQESTHQDVPSDRVLNLVLTGARHEPGSDFQYDDADEKRDLSFENAADAKICALTRQDKDIDSRSQTPDTSANIELGSDPNIDNEICDLADAEICQLTRRQDDDDTTENKSLTPDSGTYIEPAGSAPDANRYLSLENAANTTAENETCHLSHQDIDSDTTVKENKSLTPAEDSIDIESGGHPDIDDANSFLSLENTANTTHICQLTRHRDEEIEDTDSESPSPDVVSVVDDTAAARVTTPTTQTQYQQQQQQSTYTTVVEERSTCCSTVLNLDDENGPKEVGLARQQPDGENHNRSDFDCESGDNCGSDLSSESDYGLSGIFAEVSPTDGQIDSVVASTEEENQSVFDAEKVSSDFPHAERRDSTDCSETSAEYTASIPARTTAESSSISSPVFGRARQRKISSAGIPLQHFSHLNFVGVPRSSPPSEQSHNRDLQQHHAIKLRDNENELSAVSSSSSSVRAIHALGKTDQFITSEHGAHSPLAVINIKWGLPQSTLSESTVQSDDKTMSDRLPWRSRSFKSNTLSRVQAKKRSVSFCEAVGTEDDDPDAKMADCPSDLTRQKCDGVAGGAVRLKPKVPGDLVGARPTGLKSETGIDELRNMLEVLKVDFVKKYSRDAHYSPRSLSPISAPCLSPRSNSLPTTALHSPSSEISSRIQTMKMLTDKLRSKKRAPTAAPHATGGNRPKSTEIDTRNISIEGVCQNLQNQARSYDNISGASRSFSPEALARRLMNDSSLKIQRERSMSPTGSGELWQADVFRTRSNTLPRRHRLSSSAHFAEPDRSSIVTHTTTTKVIEKQTFAGKHMLQRERTVEKSFDTSESTVENSKSRSTASESSDLTSCDRSEQEAGNESAVENSSSNAVSRRRDKNAQVVSTVDCVLGIEANDLATGSTRSSYITESSQPCYIEVDVAAAELQTESSRSTSEAVPDDEDNVTKRENSSCVKTENRLSSEDEGLGIGESDASTENVNAVVPAAGKVSFSQWKTVIRHKPVFTAQSIVEQFNKLAREAKENLKEPLSLEQTATLRRTRRTVTHPSNITRLKHPLSEEAGSVDSNGLGSLRDRHHFVTPVPGMIRELPSDQSLADSCIASSSDTMEAPSCQDIVTTELDTVSDAWDRKLPPRSPMVKLKCDEEDDDDVKSDDRDDKPEFLQIVHLTENPDNGMPTLAERMSATGFNLHIPSDDIRQKCLSETLLLSLQDSDNMSDSQSEVERAVSENVPTPNLSNKPPPSKSAARRSLKKRSRSSTDTIDLKKDRLMSLAHSDDESKRYSVSRCSTAPSTPVSQSPTGSLDRRTTNSLSSSLALASPVKLNIGRSKSSASVFTNAKKKYTKSHTTTAMQSEDIRKSGNNHAAQRNAAGNTDPGERHLSPQTSEELLSPARSSSSSVEVSPEVSEPWNRVSPSGSPPKELSPPPGFKQDKRFHIVQELYSVEKEYVESLRVLVEKYMIPLKNSSIIDSNLVDDIFYKVPEMLNHHAIFLDFLEKAFLSWDEKTTVGDHIRNTFTKESVVKSYVSFIENYNISERVLENVTSNKSSFQKFIDLCQKENRRKLPLKALIIQPAQRIPRYELLLRRLIEHTPKDHPDHELLRQAENAIHELALKINAVKENKQETDMQQSLKKLELILVADLVAPDRQYVRHDMVQVVGRKEQCCLWLFSDLLICSSMKRKTGNVKSSLRLQCPTGQDFVENIKHKAWLRVGLDDLEVIKSASLNRKPVIDKEMLEQDFDTLSQINELSARLVCSHQMLEETVKDMMFSISKVLRDEARAHEMNKLDLMITSPEGLSTMSVLFPTKEKRTQWEMAFADTKLKLASSCDKRPPDFMQALPITKTRAGMQFSCAAPIDGLNANNFRDVWVCNSDGHVGHMCLLSLQPEPIVTLNTPVPSCNSRILCVCAVPALNLAFKRGGSCKGCRRKPCSIHQPQPPPKLATDSSDSSSSSEEEDFHDAEADMGQQHSDDEDGGSKGAQKSQPLKDPFKSTMWLGTEHGSILIFQSTDNIKTTRNKLKIHHNAAVLSIVYLDSRVFVSLANGDIVVYRRSEEGVWDIEKSEVKTISTSAAPVTRMLAVTGKLWCGCSKDIIIVNPATMQIENTFPVQSDSNKPVTCMASFGKGVCIATHGSSKVLLFHATTCEYLTEVCVGQAVSQKLMSADDIIRQHKTACLRITALLTCKDLLWVGTSAGVVLSIPLPIITTATTRSNVSIPNVTGLYHGHTGHVRFLASVEMPITNANSASATLESAAVPRRASMTPSATMATKMLVISGGDGYEDFSKTASDDDTMGRDDSTNHLLLWQV